MWFHLDLGNDGIHVWRANLDLKPSRVQSLQQTLAMDEQERAERFYFQKDREHFIVARGLLRTILGHYLNMEPAQLRFCYSLHGKPALAGELGRNELRFNLSHSCGLALYAITRGRELGVDVERIRPELVDEQIAERFVSPREFAILRTLPTELQQVAFFSCWTRKEAYIKARGEGLTLPLNRFDMSLTPREPATLLSTDGSRQEASRWSLQELNVGPGYTAAVAVEGHGCRVKCWQWSEEWRELEVS